MFARGQVLGFGTPIDINVTFDDAATRKRVSVPSWHQNADHKPPSTLYVFGDGEPARGEIIITTMPEEKQPLYTELKVEFVGQINVVCPEARTTTDFSCTCLELEKVRDPRIIECCKVWSYAFPGLPKPYESYNGITSQLRYCFRVTLKRPMAVDVVEEQEVWVQNPAPVAHPAVPIKMEVGLEKLLHIEFEYNKRKYAFGAARNVHAHTHAQLPSPGRCAGQNLLPEHQETSDQTHGAFPAQAGDHRYAVTTQGSRGTTGAVLVMSTTDPRFPHTGTYHENDTIAKFEVMDGHPVNGENIPVCAATPLPLSPPHSSLHRSGSSCRRTS